MSSDEDDEAFEYTVKLQRGDGTDDRDKHKATVSAETIDELEQKVERVREMMQQWAGEFRAIQPDEESPETVGDNHRTFEDYEGGDSGAE